MTNTQSAVIGLIKTAITGIKAELPDNLDFSEILKIAKKHDIAVLIYYGAVGCGLENKQPYASYLTKLYSETCRSLMVSEQQMYEVDEIFQAFDKEKIDYLPLKGILLKKMYPKPEMRAMGDADILVKPKQYAKIESVMRSLGYQEITESNHEYIWNKGSIHIELHKRLIPSYNKDYYAYFGDGWQLAKRQSGTRYIMTNEDSLIYLFTHFAKHYRDAGIGIRHMTDLWIYKKYHQDLDQQYIKDQLSQLQLYDFYINVMNTLTRWFENGKLDQKSEFITSVVFNSGIYGTKEAHVLSEGVKISKSTSHVKLKKYLTIVFLPYSSMVKKFKLLKYAPFLLPFFWIYRIFVALIFKRSVIKTQQKNISYLSNDKISTYQHALEYVGLDFNFKE
jgi:hypothetical protein